MKIYIFLFYFPTFPDIVNVLRKIQKVPDTWRCIHSLRVGSGHILSARVYGFAMADLRQQRICVKFCFKFGKTAAETIKESKEIFGDDALGQTQTYDWFKRFKND